MQEKELILEVESLVDKNAAMLQELHQSANSKEKCASLEKELKLIRDAHHTLQSELNKAKESLLKFETVKEVAKTKEE